MLLSYRNMIKLIVLLLILSPLQAGWSQDVENPEENVHIKVTVNFDFDKSDIRPEAIPFLERIYEKIRQFPQSMTQLTGHTCNIGTEQYNIGLSYRRSNSVLNYFVKEKNVPKDRFYAPMGYGETQPVASNNTREGREKNRRVEIITYKAGYTPSLPAYVPPKQQLGDVGTLEKPTLFGRILVYKYEKDQSRNMGDLGGERRLVVSYGLANGVVELTNQAETKLHRRISDNAGNFDFGELDPDFWNLEAYEDYLPEGHYFAQKGTSFELTPGMHKEITVKILPAEHKSIPEPVDVKEGDGFGLTQGNSIISRFNITFDFEKPEISPEKEPILEFVYEVLKQFPHSKIQLEGHTDAAETSSDVNSLSLSRAKAVLEYFTGKKDIPKGRFNESKGYEAKQPVSPGTTDEDRAKNRRVEIIIYKSEFSNPK